MFQRKPYPIIRTGIRIALLNDVRIKYYHTICQWDRLDYIDIGLNNSMVTKSVN